MRVTVTEMLKMITLYFCIFQITARVNDPEPKQYLKAFIVNTQHKMKKNPKKESGITITYQNVINFKIIFK